MHRNVFTGRYNAKEVHNVQNMSKIIRDAHSIYLKAYMCLNTIKISIRKVNDCRT